MVPVRGTVEMYRTTAAKCFFLFILLLPGAGCTLSGLLSSSSQTYPADGISSGRVSLSRGFFEKADAILPPRDPAGAIKIIAVNPATSPAVIVFRSTGIAGKVLFSTKNGKKLYLTFYKIEEDTDIDGFPDSAELNTSRDRKAFSNWMVRIAESQFLHQSFAWKKEQRDCAGLIRYAYREALKKHDQAWQKQSGVVIDKNLPDIRAFYYPAVPMLGKNIFKIKEGAAGDLSSFGPFADAKTLIRYNTRFVSRDPADASKGDILFFQVTENRRFPFHSMIVSERKGEKLLLIYHTGSGDTIKRVSLPYLRQSRQFNPAPWNNNFLGVFRFKIIENEIK